MIKLHTAPTPNGQKAMLMLEESGLEYEPVPVNFGKGEQRWITLPRGDGISVDVLLQDP